MYDLHSLNRLRRQRRAIGHIIIAATRRISSPAATSLAIFRDSEILARAIDLDAKYSATIYALIHFIDNPSPAALARFEQIAKHHRPIYIASPSSAWLIAV